LNPDPEQITHRHVMLEGVVHEVQLLKLRGEVSHHDQILFLLNYLLLFLQIFQEHLIILILLLKLDLLQFVNALSDLLILHQKFLNYHQTQLGEFHLYFLWVLSQLRDQSDNLALVDHVCVFLDGT
jgi:hypothetical protein